MTGPRRRVARTEVDEAIRKIRAYHAVGRSNLRALPERGRYSDRAIETAAAQLGWNATKLRKARQFADPVAGYSPERLTELWRLLSKHRPQFGITHIGILVTVGWDHHREEFQRRCIENNWSKTELEVEIKTRLGPRRHGGRTRRVSSEPGHVLVQLDEMADTWQRWIAVVSGKEAEEKQSLLETLPRQVQEHLHEVSRAVRRLREAVSPELVTLVEQYQNT